MRILPSVAILLLVLPTARLAADAQPISKALAVTATGAQYEIAGEVVSLTRYWSAVRDESGIMQVRNWTKPWRVGDLVRATIELDAPSPTDPSYVRPIARRAEVTGHRTPRPPADVFADDVCHGRIGPFEPVVLHGTVSSVIPDDIDASWSFLIVESRGEQAIVSLGWRGSSVRVDLPHLIDAEVTITGVFMPQGCGGRQYMGRNVLIEDTDAITVVHPAPDDPFAAAKPLELSWPTDFSSIADGHRRKASGTVLATWMNRDFILKTESGHPVTVRLPEGRTLPDVGTRVEATGFVRHSPFVVKLANALWRRIDGAGATEVPVNITARELFSDARGRSVVNVHWHGRLVRITGTVMDVLDRESTTKLLSLNCDGNPATAVVEDFPAPKVGSVVEVTGVCLANESPGPDDLTRLSGLMIVLRGAEDLQIVDSPSWWTPDRLLVVIGLLFATIAAGVIWVFWLNHLVQRRTRELLKEQIAHTASELRIGERTRLAIELHDSLSQTLAALSFQIASAQSAKAVGLNEAEQTHLSMAAQMLDACRTELRQCLWDLRSNTLEERDMAEAIRKTLLPVAADAEIAVDFAVPRSKIHDATAHATLMVIRELVSNAVRHGGAKHIRISGKIDGGRFVVSVADDGCGFDVEHRPGQGEGHFGISGMMQRVGRLGGTLSLHSALGTGTTAIVSFAFTNPTEGRKHE